MRTILICALLAVQGTGAYAQWLGYIPPGTPMTKDGQPDLSAPVPRGPNGKPDLSGTWHRPPSQQALRSTTPNAEAGPTGIGTGSYAGNIFMDMKPEDVPELPAAAKIRIARTADGKRLNPTVFCLPMGIPMGNLFPEVVKIIQAPSIMMILYEVDGTYRQIYLDGRKLPEDPSPAWMGYSTAHWEGDTLVVETAGFNDKSWLDMSGHSHSEALRVTERFTRHDYGHMDQEITFNDPKMYSKPFTIKFSQVIMPDSDILESYCNENEKSRDHIITK